MHTKLAEHEAVAIRQQYDFKDDGDQILLFHYHESDVYVACKALTASMQQVWDMPYEKEDAPATDAHMWILDEISDSTTEAFNCYAKNFTVLLPDREHSQFMRATLNIALKLSVDKNVCLASQRLVVLLHSETTPDLIPMLTQY